MREISEIRNLYDKAMISWKKLKNKRSFEESDLKFKLAAILKNAEFAIKNGEALTKDRLGILMSNYSRIDTKKGKERVNYSILILNWIIDENNELTIEI